MILGRGDTFINISFDYRCLYFRIRGRGLWIAPTNGIPVLYSERNKIVKVWFIPFTSYRIKILKKEDRCSL